MPEITIQPIYIRAIAVIQQLSHRIWPHAFAGILTPEQIANLLERIYSEENLKAEMTRGHLYFGAYLQNEPLGYASAYKDGDIIMLKKLYVLPEKQNEGIGTLLMNAATAALIPAVEQRLYVNKDNVAAQQYYVHKGFTRVDEVPVKMGDFDFIDYVYARALAA